MQSHSEAASRQAALPRRRLAGSQPKSLLIVRRSDVGRTLLEDFVSSRFRQAYGAKLCHFLPVLLGLKTEASGLIGVIGANAAAHSEQLMLEHYLDEPLEAVASRILGRDIPRDTLVEVGNLSTDCPGGGRWLISALAFYLRGAGMRHAVFTSTAQLRNLFSHLGVELVDLGSADENRLCGHYGQWGSYYQNSPRISWVDIQQLCIQVQLMPRVRAAMAGLWNQAYRQGLLSRSGLPGGGFEIQ